MAEALGNMKRLELILVSFALGSADGITNTIVDRMNIPKIPVTLAKAGLLGTSIYLSDESFGYALGYGTMFGYAKEFSTLIMEWADKELDTQLNLPNVGL